MAARSLASLTVNFGLVSIPVKLYSATESSTTIRFNLLAPDGSRLKQQYVTEKDRKVVERAEMVKGYEFEKDRFVTFTSAELKTLEEAADPGIEIVAFVPESSVDPIYYDKAYYLAPDKRGGKPYALLMAAMRKSRRCALARWSWKSRQHVVQLRPGDGGLVLQQLLYADEIRAFKDLDIEAVAVSDAELKLALQLIEQIADDSYHAESFQDEERQRILAAIDEKIAGRQIVTQAPHAETAGAQVIDLMEALRASLGGPKASGAAGSQGEHAGAGPRKGARRAPARAVSADAPAKDGGSVEAAATGTDDAQAAPPPKARRTRR